MCNFNFDCYHVTSPENAEKIVKDSCFIYNPDTKNSNRHWLGEGIYFWKQLEDCDTWRNPNSVESGKYCTIKANLTCKKSSFVDLDKNEEMDKLVSFAEAVNVELKSNGIIIPKFKRPEETRHFYCTLYKKRNNIKLMRHTFIHSKENSVGFRLSQRKTQLCATDSSIIHKIKLI